MTAPPVCATTVFCMSHIRCLGLWLYAEIKHRFPCVTTDHCYMPDHRTTDIQFTTLICTAITEWAVLYIPQLHASTWCLHQWLLYIDNYKCVNFFWHSFTYFISYCYLPCNTVKLLNVMILKIVEILHKCRPCKFWRLSVKATYWWYRPDGKTLL